ncbi:hypothetical protein L6452_39605 [Arctium lappa]|uniref:Uncharacterized protein n=1 Tax=Arctium lappa TaxID=4217 RepID=A0ACB8XTH4_ARCLA|nr:hypothetical protein L6452_39605 [Arctium lappa]
MQVVLLQRDYRTLLSSKEHCLINLLLLSAVPSISFSKSVFGDCLDEELESWVRCLRASELVGICGSCIEQYLPHRVAMQFGMDQDIPGDLPQTNASPETAWRFCTRPIRDVKVYLPSKLCEPCMTARYLEWWNKPVGVQARSSPMGDDETLESFDKDESRTEGSKEGGVQARSSPMGDDETLETFDKYESRTEGSKEVGVQARIRKLEEVFAHLKSKKIGHRKKPALFHINRPAAFHRQSSQ